MIPRELYCCMCGCELSGGLDTYGSPGQDRCYDCHMKSKRYTYPSPDWQQTSFLQPALPTIEPRRARKH